MLNKDLNDWIESDTVKTLTVYPFSNLDVSFDVSVCIDNNDNDANYKSYISIDDWNLTLPNEATETSISSSAFCNEIALYWIKTWIPHTMVMVVAVVEKLFGVKLPKTNNTSERSNKIYGHDIDELIEPQREDLLMKSLKAVVAREYTIFASNSVINTGITDAEKVKDETTKFQKTNEEKELIRLFDQMCNKRFNWK